jgi:hypothetical protein
MLVPQSNKTILAQKPQIVVKKTRMYRTNCHMTNHNVETYRIKRKKNHVPTISKVIIQQNKVRRPVRYSCHICGDTGHKIIDCPKYNDMQNMFKNKGVKPTKKTSYGRTQGFKSFSPCGGCEYGHHQEQGY